MNSENITMTIFLFSDCSLNRISSLVLYSDSIFSISLLYSSISRFIPATVAFFNLSSSLSSVVILL